MAHTCPYESTDSRLRLGAAALALAITVAGVGFGAAERFMVATSIEAKGPTSTPITPAQASDLASFLARSGFCAYSNAPDGLSLSSLLRSGVFRDEPRQYPSPERPEYLIGETTGGASLYVDAAGWCLACFTGHPLREPAARAFYTQRVDPWRLVDVVKVGMRAGAKETDPTIALYDFSVPAATHVVSVGTGGNNDPGSPIEVRIPAGAVIHEASAGWNWNAHKDECRLRWDHERVRGASGMGCADDYGTIAPRRLTPGQHRVVCESGCVIVFLFELERGPLVFTGAERGLGPTRLRCPNELVDCDRLRTYRLHLPRLANAE